MESLNLTYKLIALKIKSKTLDRIYFMSQVFQEHSQKTEGKNKKMKITKIYLFFLPTLPSQDGGGRIVATPPPPPPTLFTAKILENFFHRYMGLTI